MSFSSRITRPCIWPPKLIPATCDLSASFNNSLSPSIAWAYQSSGFCSDQPGCGKNKGYSLVTVPWILPVSSISTSLTDDVPKSTPMYNIYVPPRIWKNNTIILHILPLFRTPYFAIYYLIIVTWSLCQ